jgi:CheY-like chemotaxis protein
LALILVVDDEPDLLALLVDQVSSLGYDVVAARDGTEGLRLAIDRAPDVILTDVIMPYMDGGELAERARDLHPRLPIVLMSAYPVGDIAELVAAYPELPFLEKPFTTEALHRALTPLLGPPAKAKGRRANDRVRYRDRARQSS